MKSEISRKLIKQFLANRQNDPEFKPTIPINPGDEIYPKSMVKLLNFEVDKLTKATPAT